MLINVIVEVQIILSLWFSGKKHSSLFVDFEFAWHRNDGATGVVVSVCGIV